MCPPGMVPMMCPPGMVPMHPGMVPMCMPPGAAPAGKDGKPVPMVPMYMPHPGMVPLPPPPAEAAGKQSMKDAQEMLQNAALVMKRRRCMVAVDEVPGFVRTVYTLLRVCDADIICWSEDGTQILIKEPERFAAEVCPKFFRHRNFNSFTRLLNMYQFHKVPSVQRDSKDVCFEHPHFQRGRDDLLPLVQRKGAQTARDELLARDLWERSALGLSHPGALESALGPLHGGTGGSYARRMGELESEVKNLKAQNERVKALESERETLKCQVRTQEDLINVLQVSQPQKMLDATPALPALDAEFAAQLPPPPACLEEALKTMGGPMMLMMSMMTGAFEQGLQAEAAAAEAAASAAALALKMQSSAAVTPVEAKPEPPAKKTRTK